MITKTVERSRKTLQSLDHCRFVDKTEFCKLLVSRCTLVRADDSDAHAHGLMDPRTGWRFLIEDELLFPPERSVAR